MHAFLSLRISISKVDKETERQSNRMTCAPKKQELHHKTKGVLKGKASIDPPPDLWAHMVRPQEQAYRKHTDGAELGTGEDKSTEEGHTSSRPQPSDSTAFSSGLKRSSWLVDVALFLGLGVRDHG